MKEEGRSLTLKASVNDSPETGETCMSLTKARGARKEAFFSVMRAIPGVGVVEGMLAIPLRKYSRLLLAPQ